MNKDGNEISKIYPDLNPTAPLQQEINPQNYWVAKISKFEPFLLGDIAKREKLAKKMKDLVINSNAVSMINYGSHYIW